MEPKKTGGIGGQIQPSIALQPTNRTGNVRRWLGLYTAEEKEVMAYAQRVKRYSISVLSGQIIMTERPEWLRYEDYTKLRSTLKQAEKRKAARRR